MADALSIPNETETRATSRHAELVSASMAVASDQHRFFTRKWTLKQVQRDGVDNG